MTGLAAHRRNHDAQSLYVHQRHTAMQDQQVVPLALHVELLCGAHRWKIVRVLAP